MSDVRPFRALRPKPELAGKVAALPYDVMSSEEAREMVKDNPFSFLRVTKAEINLDPSADVYSGEVYAKAKDRLDEMEREGILFQDAKPFYYVYRQTMNGRSQTGFVACASIDEYIEGKIKKHELTREEKEQDRIRHVDVTNANTGPVFLTFHATEDMNAILDGVVKTKPEYDFIAEDGIGHTAWVVTDDRSIELIREAFAKLPALYIADGHHRNASAVKVGLARRKADPLSSKDAEHNYYLSVIFPDNQLHIMDYNRVVKGLNGLSDDEFLKKAGEKFEIEEKSAAYRPERLHTFGMYMNGKWYKLTAKQEIIPQDVVAALDVSVLQDNILRPLLGIDDPRTSHYIDFVGGLRGLGELESRVDSGEMKVAFAMFPTSMDELMSIADSGKIMPPKSTWFEPKLRSGLFIHKLS